MGEGAGGLFDQVKLLAQERRWTGFLNRLRQQPTAVSGTIYVESARKPYDPGRGLDEWASPGEYRAVVSWHATPSSGEPFSFEEVLAKQEQLSRKAVENGLLPPPRHGAPGRIYRLDESFNKVLHRMEQLVGTGPSTKVFIRGEKDGHFIDLGDFRKIVNRNLQDTKRKIVKHRTVGRLKGH